MTGSQYNEKAYKFYECGLELLQSIKTNTDEIIVKQDEIMCMQNANLKQSKMTNVYLESMTDLRLTEDDII